MMYGHTCIYTHTHTHTHTCITVHHVPKCMSCHKAIVVVTTKVHCFHDCMYIYVVSMLSDYHIYYISKWNGTSGSEFTIFRLVFSKVITI